MCRHGFSMTGKIPIALDRRSLVLMICAFLLISPMAVLSEESCLDAISVEAQKLEDGSAGGAGAGVSKSAAAADDPAAKFERELCASYRGTDLFYEKLPSKSQQQAFLEYQQAAPIKNVRKTTISRYLHGR